MSERRPQPGDKFVSVGTGEDDEDEEFTIREVTAEPDEDDLSWEVVAEEDGETYEIQDDGVGNWVGG